jgi:hypothetical protein
MRLEGFDARQIAEIVRSGMRIVWVDHIVLSTGMMLRIVERRQVAYRKDEIELPTASLPAARFNSI